MLANYLLLALLWAAYCAVHSALISITVTSWFKRVLAGRYRFYRMFYDVFSLISLIPLVIYSHSPRFSSQPLFAWSGNWGIIRHSLVALAVVLFLAGARRYSMLQFLGISQIRKAAAGGAMTVSGGIDDTGVLGWTRHPWYLAVFILLWTSELEMAAVTINITLSAYLMAGTLLEERKLAIEFGQEYRRYQDRVSMFIPVKRLTAGRLRRDRPRAR